MIVNDTKICQKMKNKSWLSIEKNIIKGEKTLYCNYKKLFSFRKFVFLLGLGQVKWVGKYKELPSVKIMVFFYFALGFRKFAKFTKSAIILGYEKIFYSMLNQHPSQSIRIFFMLNLHPSWSIGGNKKFYTWSAPSQNITKFFFGKI